MEKSKKTIEKKQLKIRPKNNEELAIAYLNVFPENKGRGGILKSKLIKSYLTNLAEYFLQNNNFSEIKIKGIGEETFKILGLIMKFGEKGTRMIVKKGLDDKLQNEINNIHGRINPLDTYGNEEDPYFENIVKIYEES